MISCEFLKVFRDVFVNNMWHTHSSLYVECNGGLTVVYTENVYPKPREEGN